MCSAIVLLLFLATGHLVSSMDFHLKCAKYTTPLDKRITLLPDDPKNIQGRAFQSLSFRANNYGSSKYKLEASYNGVFQLSIEMENGPRPDSVKGGDLSGFYALYRSYITLRKNLKTGNSKTVLEIWNVYVRKNNSAADSSAHNVVSLNVEFEIGKRRNNQIDLIIKAVKKLSRAEPKTMLSYNYDLYEFLPLETSFGIYETTKFPFAYPQLSDMKPLNKQKAPCGPIIKVYRFNTPLTISQNQFDEFVNHVRQLQAKFPRNVKSVESNEVAMSDAIPEKALGRIYLTPTTEHLLFRRLVAEAYVRKPGAVVGDFEDDTHGGGAIPAEGHADDMDDEDEDEQEGSAESGTTGKNETDPNDPNSVLAHQKSFTPHDAESFPEDCVFLFKIHDQIMKREGDRHGAKSRVGARADIGIITTIGMLFVALLVSGFN